MCEIERGGLQMLVRDMKSRAVGRGARQPRIRAATQAVTASARTRRHLRRAAMTGVSAITAPLPRKSFTTASAIPLGLPFLAPAAA